MLTKYAEAAEGGTLDVIDAFVVPENVGHKRLSRLRRRAHRHEFEYSPRPGYIYVRSRAISSRCNDNYDEFPATEIKKAYRSFVGKPVFVNHHNSDHRRARGVIIDAALHEDTNPDGSEDVWAEVLMEVDAKRFPVLAREVLSGNIARTSMGTDVEYSVCTACGNRASTPADYCQHIPRMKGMKLKRFNAVEGGYEEVLIAERCYGLRFFENSLLVEDPADPTAFGWVDHDASGLSTAAAKAVIHEAEDITRESATSTRAVEAGLRQVLADAPNLMDMMSGAPAMKTHRFRKAYEEAETVLAAIQGGDNSPAMIARAEQAMAELREAAQQAGVIAGRRTASRQSRSAVEDLLSEFDGRREAAGPWPYVPGAPSAGHVTSGGWWHPGPIEGCSKCGDDGRTASRADEEALDRIRAADYRQLLDLTDQNARLIEKMQGRPDYTTDVARLERQNEVAFERLRALTASREAGLADWFFGDETWDCPECGHHHGWDDDDEACARCGAPAPRFDLTFGPRAASHYEAITYGPGARFSGYSTVEKAIEVALENLPIQKQVRAPEYVTGYVVLELPGHSGPVYQVYDDEEQAPGGLMPSSQRPPGKVVARVDANGKVTKTGSRHVHAYGETKAPAKVDTMRAESCPVCGDDEAYNGEKCNVCGYMQPPDQFRDPDLDKARETDLRQEQGEPAVEGVDPEAAGEDLQCDQCGEVFSAEGDAASGSDPSEDEEAEPDAPDDTEDPDDPQARDAQPWDDDEPEVEPEDEEEFDPKANTEPEDEVDPDFDPAVGEAEITAEPEEDQPDADGLEAEVQSGATCPVCGQGTLRPKKEQQDPQEVGVEDPTEAKEERVAMSKPNPAQQSRNRLIAAIREQQQTIQRQSTQMARQDAQIGHLTRAVASLSIAAGVDSHPHFAGLVRQSGLRRRAADDTNNSPSGAPSTSTEEAKKPDSTDDVENVGAAPGEANKGVTPEGVTDVNNSDVTVNPPVLDNLQDPTKPVSGTDAPTPDAGDAESASRVTVGEPSTKAFDEPGDSGWKSTSARGDERERFVASMRLARLRQEAGLTDGEDLVLAQEIDKSEATLGEITAQVEALSAVASNKQASPEQARRLVPRAAQRGAQPASRQQPSMQSTGSSRSSDDEWMMGLDDLG